MDGKRTLTEGMIAGFLGYAVVAVFFAAVNMILGNSPFHTAFALGSAFGAGWPGPGEAAGVVLAANGVHLVISVLVGLGAAWVVMEIEHHHGLWYAGVLAFGGGLLAAVIVAGIVGAEITAVVTWTEAAGASLLYALVVGSYFAWVHRGLVATLQREIET